MNSYSNFLLVASQSNEQLKNQKCDAENSKKSRSYVDVPGREDKRAVLLQVEGGHH